MIYRVIYRVASSKRCSGDSVQRFTRDGRVWGGFLKIRIRGDTNKRR